MIEFIMCDLTEKLCEMKIFSFLRLFAFITRVCHRKRKRFNIPFSQLNDQTTFVWIEYVDEHQ